MQESRLGRRHPDSHDQTASADEPREPVYVDIDTFEATF